MDKPADDGASEKLVIENNAVAGSEEPKVEIKNAADSQNGDTKISIGDLKQTFVGMGKDELMKFANDPFWVRMRWILFILFWLSWFGMLAGAIGIIFLAPKCTAPAPKAWFEVSPVYALDIYNFQDGSSPPDGLGDIQGIIKKLDYIKKLGIGTVLVDNLAKSKDSDPKHIEDFMALDETLGTLDDLKNLIRGMKEKGMHLLMNLVPNYSSVTHDWFQRSVKREEPFTDYYIWAAGAGKNEDGTFNPPNNWLSIYGGSAWEWNEERGEFYLHQFNKSQPDLNFRNEQVVNYFGRVFKFWLNLGVSGFHVTSVQYLLEDPGFSNEMLNPSPGAVHDQYEFYSHTHTAHLPENLDLLASWSSTIKNSSGILSLSGLPADDARDFVDLLWYPIHVPGKVSAEGLAALLKSKINKVGLWKWECFEEGCQDILPGLKTISLLLPGTVLIESGEELGIEPHSIIPWTGSDNAGFTSLENFSRSLPSNYSTHNVAVEVSSESSSYTTYKALIEARESSSVMHGATDIQVLNDTILTFTRIKKGHPGYLVVFNVGDDSKTVDLGLLSDVPKEVNLVARSSNVFSMYSLKSKINTAALTLPNSAFLALTFVPKADES